MNYFCLLRNYVNIVMKVVYLIVSKLCLLQYVSFSFLALSIMIYKGDSIVCISINLFLALLSVGS